MAKKKSFEYWPYLSIVLIVAIVGAVVLYTNSGKAGVSASTADVSDGEDQLAVSEGDDLASAEEEDMAGEARKVISSKSKVSEQNLCEKCNIKTPVLIDFNTIKNHYGNGDFQTTKTAYQICENLGYNGCFAGQITGIIHYYESTDGSCMNPQLYSSSYELVSCDYAGFNLAEASCNNVDGFNVKEPVFGDSKYHRILSGVICFE